MSVQYTAIFHGCKNDNFQMKIVDIFLIYAQNIDCGYTLEPPRGGSNEYPQSMFRSKNKKKYVYPSKPHFFYIKVGCKGVFITRTCYPDDVHLENKMESYVKKNEWGYKIFMAGLTSNKRGVMVLLNNNFQHDIGRVVTDPNGNFLFLRSLLKAKRLHL